MMWVEHGSIAESDRWYFSEYGKEKWVEDVTKYKARTGKYWGDIYAEMCKDDENYSLEEFHKNVVLKAIK